MMKLVVHWKGLLLLMFRLLHMTLEEDLQDLVQGVLGSDKEEIHEDLREDFNFDNNNHGE